MLDITDGPEPPDLLGDEAPPLPQREPERPEALLVESEQIYQHPNMRSSLQRIEELAASVGAQGLIHPVRLRPSPAGASHGKPWELVAGYRRMAACQELGWKQIPALMEEMNEAEMLGQRLAENLQRDDPTPIDEAREMQRMIEVLGLSQGQVARIIGVHRTQVTKRLKLLELPERVRDWVTAGTLNASAAEVISRMDSPDQQEQLAELAVRTEASVNKLNSYASTIKAESEREIKDEDVAVPAETPLQSVSVSDVMELPHLRLREELSEEEHARLELYVLLRSAHDQEALEYLSERGFEGESLWDWVRALSLEQARDQSRVMLRRWAQAAHRFPLLPAGLKAELGSGEESGPTLQGPPEWSEPREEQDDDEGWKESWEG